MPSSVTGRRISGSCTRPRASRTCSGDGVEVVPGPGDDGATVRVSLLLTTSGCPLKDRLTGDTTREVGALPGVARVAVPDEAGLHRLSAVLTRMDADG